MVTASVPAMRVKMTLGLAQIAAQGRDSVMASRRAFGGYEFQGRYVVGVLNTGGHAYVPA